MNAFRSIFYAMTCSMLAPMVMAQTAAAPAAAAPAKTQGTGGPTKAIAPIFGQLVLTTYPAGFKTVFEESKGPQYIREAVLDGESTQAWTQMITVTGMKGGASNPAITPRFFADSLAAGFKRACPSTFGADIIGAGKIDGYDSFVAVASCGTSPSTGGKTSESALLVVIRGDSDYYTIQWAERGPSSITPQVLDKARWTEKLKQLTPIKLCKIVPGEAAPYPSCIGP